METNKMLRLFLIVFFTLFIVSTVDAKDEWVEIDSVTWILDYDKDRAPDMRYQATLRHWRRTSDIFVEVPEEITYKKKTYKVTWIYQAFRNLPNLEEVHIGKNVKHVMGQSFYNCPNLRRIICEGRPDVPGSIVACPNFEGIYLADSDEPFTRVSDISNVKAKTVRTDKFMSIRNLFSTKGCDIDTLYISTDEKLHFIPNTHSRIGTVVIERMATKARQKYAKDCVIQTTIENLVIGDEVDYLPYKFVESNTLKTIKENGSVNTCVDGCFVGMTGLNEVNSDNKLIQAEVYYAQGMADTWNIVGGHSKELLKKASDLGCSAATNELTIYMSDDNSTKELLKKSIEQGNNTPDVKEHLLFFDKCGELHKYYQNIQTNIKANKTDTTNYARFIAVAKEVLSPIDGSRLKYYSTEYKKLPDEIYCMLYYYSLCDAINLKLKASYYYDPVIGVDRKGMTEAMDIFTYALSACDRAAKLNLDTSSKNFFANNQKLVQEKKDQFDKKVNAEREQYRKMQEQNRIYDEKMRKSREEERAKIAERVRQKNLVRYLKDYKLMQFNTDEMLDAIWEKWEKGYTAKEQEEIWKNTHDILNAKKSQFW